MAKCLETITHEEAEGDYEMLLFFVVEPIRKVLRAYLCINEEGSYGIRFEVQRDDYINIRQTESFDEALRCYNIPITLGGLKL